MAKKKKSIVSIKHANPNVNGRRVTPYGEIELVKGKVARFYPYEEGGEVDIANYLDGIQSYTVTGLDKAIETNAPIETGVEDEDNIVETADAEDSEEDTEPKEKTPEPKEKTPEPEEKTPEPEEKADETIEVTLTGDNTHDDIDDWIDEHKEQLPDLAKIPDRKHATKSERLTEINAVVMGVSD